MQHIWSILCHKASIDSATNSLSLFECLEQINVTIDRQETTQQEKIGIPIDFEMVQFWRDNNIKTERKFKIKIELKDPDKNVLQNFDGELVFKKNVKRLRNRMNIKGFPITVEGEYNFVVKLKHGNKYKEVVAVPIDVILQYKLLDSKK